MTGARAGTGKLHALDLRFDFSGYDADAQDGVQLSVRTEVEFTGVILRPENFGLSRGDREALLALAADHIDLLEFDVEETDSGALRFAARAAQ